MSSVKDGDAEAFLAELEARRGAPVTFRTFSTFYVDSQCNIRRYGVFVYVCAGRIWFEDFEHEVNLFGFRLKPRKGTPKYERFESSFSPSDVVSIRTVGKNKVLRCASGQGDFQSLKETNPVMGLLIETLTEISLNDGNKLYFQFMDKKVLNTLLKGE